MYANKSHHINFSSCDKIYKKLKLGPIWLSCLWILANDLISAPLLSSQKPAYIEQSWDKFKESLMGEISSNSEIKLFFLRQSITISCRWCFRPCPKLKYANPPPTFPQKWPYLHERCWIGWKIIFQIFQIFIFVSYSWFWLQFTVTHQVCHWPKKKKFFSKVAKFSGKIRIDLTMIF